VVPELIQVTGPADGVARITLDRPDKKNALSIRLRDEVSDALDALAADERRQGGRHHGRG
jgi:enoyl-CoA hydratase/carnithine racemase